MQRIAISGLGLFIFVSAASVFGRTFWMFELLTHFRVQYAVAGAVLALALAMFRRWVGAGISLALGLAHAVPVLSLFVAPPSTDAPTRPNVKVVTMNLRHRFADVEATRRLIRAERPDIVILTEYLADHVPMMDSLRDILPHRAGTPPRGKFDTVLLSRMPIVWSRIYRPTGPSFPVVEARLCPAPGDQAACFTLIALHAPRSEFARGTRQKKVFELVAQRAVSVADGRVIVVGDLNTTPYSPRYRDLVADGGLRDAAVGSPWRTTWISRFPPFGLTLDHVLVGPALTPFARRVAGDIGSDHFPVIAEITVDGL